MAVAVALTVGLRPAVAVSVAVFRDLGGGSSGALSSVLDARWPAPRPHAMAIMPNDAAARSLRRFSITPTVGNASATVTPVPPAPLPPQNLFQKPCKDSRAPAFKGRGRI